MQLPITLPEYNVGREDRLIRAVVAACLLTMSAFGFISTLSLSLISLMFGVSGAYVAWSAVTARCFVYNHLAVDTRSETEAHAHRLRAAALAAERERMAALRAAMPVEPAPEPEPIVFEEPAYQWGHSLIGGR
jgi:hypothetical protein